MNSLVSKIAAGNSEEATDKEPSEALAKGPMTAGLETVYPILYLDTFEVQIEEDGKLQRRTVCLALGVAWSGHRDVLGYWVRRDDSASFWTMVLRDLRRRGVTHVAIVCGAASPGLDDACVTELQGAVLRTGVVHTLRATLAPASATDRRVMMRDLKEICGARNVSQARASLEIFEEKWGKKYLGVTSELRQGWTEMTVFLGLPAAVRRFVYTARNVEQLHRQLGRLLHGKMSYPSEAALEETIEELTNFGKRPGPSGEWASAQYHLRFLLLDARKAS